MGTQPQYLQIPLVLPSKRDTARAHQKQAEAQHRWAFPAALAWPLVSAVAYLASDDAAFVQGA